MCGLPGLGGGLRGAECLDQRAVDGLKIEVPVAHPLRDRVRTGAADRGDQVLQRDCLEPRLGGIIRDQFVAVAGDGRLAFGVEGGRDDQQTAGVIVSRP